MTPSFSPHLMQLSGVFSAFFFFVLDKAPPDDSDGACKLIVANGPWSALAFMNAAFDIEICHAVGEESSRTTRASSKLQMSAPQGQFMLETKDCRSFLLFFVVVASLPLMMSVGMRILLKCKTL